MPLDIEEYRSAARKRLPHGVFEYLDRGTQRETDVQYNRKALNSVRLKPGVLMGTASRRQTTYLFGETLDSPIVIAPTAFAGLLWHKGKIAVVRAASTRRIPFCAATEAITSVQDIISGAGGNVWFQLYLWRDTAQSIALVDRAWDKGVKTLVLTVHTPVYPKRIDNHRNGFSVPLKLTMRNTLGVRFSTALHGRERLARPTSARSYPPN